MFPRCQQAGVRQQGKNIESITVQSSLDLQYYVGLGCNRVYTPPLLVEGQGLLSPCHKVT